MLLYTDTRLFGVNGWTKMCTTDYSIGPKNNVLERNHIYSSKSKILEEIIKNYYAFLFFCGFLKIFAFGDLTLEYFSSLPVFILF